MIVATSEQMKAIDRKTIEEYHIPGVLLMEHAALKVVEVIEEVSDTKDVIIVCGTGNNGGDGLAVARLLCLKGVKVSVLMVGNIEKQSADAKVMYRALLGLEVSIHHILNRDDLDEVICRESDLIVDALFGISCHRPLTAIYEEVVNWVNEMQSDVVSVDVPSGINSDTGHVMGVAVEALATVTFTAPKVGITAGPGRIAAGSLYVVDIGIPETVLEDFTYNYELIDQTIMEYLPARPEDGHKMSFGRLLIVAGSASMSGAGILATKAAYRAGAGLVEVITHKNGLSAIQESVPEAIIHSYGSVFEGYEVLEKISGRVGTYSGILIGPGISTTDFAKDLLISILDHGKCPVIIDADGLNLLPSVLPLVEAYAGSIILTPHIGEMSRLTGHAASDIINDPFAYGEAYSKAHQVITVLKSNATIITDGNDKFCINGMGNQGMATAGSGDVLAGIILAMVGQEASPFMAAVLGVGIHSMSGDLMAETIGQHGLMASDIIEGLSKILK